MNIGEPNLPKPSTLHTTGDTMPEHNPTVDVETVNSLAFAAFGAIANQIKLRNSTVQIGEHDYTRTGKSQAFPWVSSSHTELHSDEAIQNLIATGEAHVKDAS